MDTLDFIKKEIVRLYETKPEVHVSITKTHPKVIVEKSAAVIVGVYKNIFQVEEKGSVFHRRYTLQYSDVLIGQVVIHELDYDPTVSVLNKK